MSNDRPRIAVVLSGGGARGAYEAGVLSFILGDVARRLGRPIHFDILTGTSVGAIHACYLAGAQAADDCGERLVEVWRSLSFDSVMELSPRAVLRIPWKLLGFGGSDEIEGGRRLQGLFNTAGLEALVLSAVDWRALRANIDSGRLAGLAVAATEIASGRSFVFVDCPGGDVPDCAADPLVVTRGARMEPVHALASAAIPMIFPAIKVGERFYSDGGLRMNTPLAPALRLGADRVLVIGLRHDYGSQEPTFADERETVAQSPIYLAGKALNALLLDRVEYDLGRMRLFNAILRNGIDAYGEGFLERINEPIIKRRGRPYKIVESIFVRPSDDLGVTAAQCMRSQLRSATGGTIKRTVLRYLSETDMSEADFLSYLYFDGCFAEQLIDMGRQDAAAMEDELVEFFDI